MTLWHCDTVTQVPAARTINTAHISEWRNFLIISETRYHSTAVHWTVSWPDNTHAMTPRICVQLKWALTTQSDCVITKLKTGKSPGKNVKPRMARLLISFLLLTGTVARWQESIRPKMVVDYLKQHAGKKIRDLNSIIADWCYGYNSQHSWRSNDKVWSPRVTNGCCTNHFSTGVTAVTFTQNWQGFLRDV